MTTYHDNKAIKEVGSLKARSILHCETNQCHGFLIQASKLYENPSYVPCFLVGTLPCVYHSKKNSWSPSTYWNQWWTRIWNGRHFGFMGLYLSILVFCSLAWVWCEWMHLGTNQEPIKCYGEGAWVLLTISKQAQVCFVEFIAKRGGDVTDVNAMRFIPLNVHPWLVLNLCLTLNLVSVHF